MPLEDADRAWVRTHIRWDPPDDSALDDLYDDPTYGGTPAAVVVWFLRDKLSEFLETAADLSLPGGVRLNASKNIDVLEGRLKAIGANLPTDPGSDPRAVTVLGLRRVGVDRG